MSIRVDTEPLIADSLVVGDTGHGVLAQEIPTGGFLYPFLSFPDDTGVEVRGYITSTPSGPGNVRSFFARENSTTDLEVDVTGTYTFGLEIYRDGVLSSTSNASLRGQIARAGAPGRRKRSTKYPRRVVIDGQVYTVKSAEEERELLRQWQESVESDALQLVLEEAPKKVIAKAKAKVVRAERRIEEVDNREAEWLARLMDEDEEILLLLH